MRRCYICTANQKSKWQNERRHNVQVRRLCSTSTMYVNGLNEISLLKYTFWVADNSLGQRFVNFFRSSYLIKHGQIEKIRHGLLQYIFEYLLFKYPNMFTYVTKWSKNINVYNFSPCLPRKGFALRSLGTAALGNELVVDNRHHGYPDRKIVVDQKKKISKHSMEKNMKRVFAEVSKANSLLKIVLSIVLC